MLAELVFVTRFLGLVSGPQPLVLETDAAVQRIEIRRDGQTVARLDAPPWKTVIDVGRELTPFELTAVGFDAEGAEIDSVTQVVNLPRPRAELEILLARAADGSVTATLRWEHLRKLEPKRVTVLLDGREVACEGRVAGLGALDPSGVHVVSAVAHFRDGSEARREIVFGGVYSEEMQTELTAVGVRTSEPASAEACLFDVASRAVAPAAEEAGRASISFVLNGITTMALQGENRSRLERLTDFTNADFRLVSPVAEKPGREGHSAIFPVIVMPAKYGLPQVLAYVDRRQGPKRFADALAVAGLRSLSGRRVVVLVLGRRVMPDASAHAPGTTRRFLERIGVPLRVWSLTGPRPDLEPEWGSIRDVSGAGELAEAVRELRAELETQKIVWIPAKPIDAWRARAGSGCRFTSLARPAIEP